MSPVKMLQMVSNTTVVPSHQGPLNGKEDSGKWILRIILVVQDPSHSSVDGEAQGGIPHIIFTTPDIGVFFNGTPHYRH